MVAWWRVKGEAQWNVGATFALKAVCDSSGGRLIGRCHVKTLMKRMGIEALYRRPRTPSCLA
jgi:hypothetical protein